MEVIMLKNNKETLKKIALMYLGFSVLAVLILTVITKSFAALMGALGHAAIIFIIYFVKKIDTGKNKKYALICAYIIGVYLLFEIFEKQIEHVFEYILEHMFGLHMWK